jgi:hypothetical protein
MWHLTIIRLLVLPGNRHGRFATGVPKFRKNFQAVEEAPAHDYRLPTETEWELAARGGLNGTITPGEATIPEATEGCFVANFKPLRGNYVADSPTTTVAMKTGQFDPNNYGLYDMAGNVAEWTSSAFYEAAYDIISDLNPEMEYDAKPDDPPVMKRKVIRGVPGKIFPILFVHQPVHLNTRTLQNPTSDFVVSELHSKTICTTGKSNPSDLNLPEIFNSALNQL